MKGRDVVTLDEAHPRATALHHNTPDGHQQSLNSAPLQCSESGLREDRFECLAMTGIDADMISNSAITRRISEVLTVSSNDADTDQWSAKC